ncbi:nuclear transport factor 2 family protein [Jannaschia seohaensis]|uniref:SnoaL-like domain-containing protein n=1 Tax=Jannaschia seohaensis TaxID=475081 RepID=A0A2Y9AVL9_9RHOB|nr:nuclear transport factor 2 family protein [Jannaschia seohaensis]PWJ17033.1 SnoaL-like protein [Jannaschia seohaensis]SSA48370.1 SnoaL-like domain-containing protein [Jannaschia seohaensis]
MPHARTLEGLCDRAEITDLIHAYCFHFDRADPDGVAALFTEDAVIDYGPDVDIVTGAAALHAMVTKGATTLFAATSHHVSNVTVTFETPDRATSNCYLYAWHRYRADGRESELWGQYDHTFQRTGAGWRIARLTLSAAGTRAFHRANMHPVPRKLGP